MFSKTLSAAVVVAASTLVSAQTYTDCNPLTTTCPADPAVGSNSITCDFTKGACDAFTVLAGTTLTYSSQGAKFDIVSKTNAPTIRANNYIFFGRVDVVLQAAPGAGIVTSAVLQSDDLDEIDWEWVGGDNSHAQSNYYSKGQTETYDRGAYHEVSNPVGSYHTYSVEWTPTYIHWLIDNNVVRTLLAADAHGVDGFPQTPMQVKLGTWVANAAGTAEWAGGYADFADAPFDAYYKSVTIVDYAGKSGPSEDSNVKQYVYGDHSGDWESIIVEYEDGSSASGTANTKGASKTTTAASKSTSTKAAAQTTSKADADTKTSGSATDKTSADKTTFATATATSTSGSKTSSSSSSGSSSGSVSGSASGSASTPTSTADASATVSTLPTGAASKTGASMVMAAAGLLAMQFLI